MTPSEGGMRFDVTRRFGHVVIDLGEHAGPLQAVPRRYSNQMRATNSSGASTSSPMQTSPSNHNPNSSRNAESVKFEDLIKTEEDEEIDELIDDDDDDDSMDVDSQAESPLRQKLRSDGCDIANLLKYNKLYQLAHPLKRSEQSF